MPALLFDFDGLIVDSETVISRALIEVMAEEGVDITMADFGHLIGWTGKEADLEWQRLASAWLGNEIAIEKLDERIGARLAGRHHELPLLPGVEETIREARERGWKIGLATGSERRNIVPQLRRLGIESAFDSIVCAEDITRGKPAPDIYVALSERLGVPAADCIVLEDSVPGCEAALAAGMTVVLCPCDATRGCSFPEDAQMVPTLLELDLDLVVSR